MQNNFYTFGEGITKKPNNDDFYLHNHNSYEIYLFMQGDAKYIVEEKNYDLSHGDIIIIRKQEMHKVFHTSTNEYRRIIIMLSPDFFSKNSCEEFENIFLLDTPKAGNKIRSDIVKSSGLYDAFMRFKNYSNNFSTPYTIVAKSVLFEILYLLNKISCFENPEINENIRNIIHYLNNNFTDNISLNTLCDKFYISKYHLCHVFKKATGLTVQQYIKEKRLTKALELISNGSSLTETALQVGFDNYSSFFRAFTKRYQSNPTNYKR